MESAGPERTLQFDNPSESMPSYLESSSLPSTEIREGSAPQTEFDDKGRLSPCGHTKAWLWEYLDLTRELDDNFGS
jgi:hypothetical protein